MLFSRSLSVPADQRHGGLRTISPVSGAGPEHVQVTNGGSEANCITLMYLLAPGDDVVVMMPNYMQVRGLARGCERHHWHLPTTGDERAEMAAGSRWLRLVTSGRVRSSVTNNPTGARLAPELDGSAPLPEDMGLIVSTDLSRSRAGWRRDANDVGRAWRVSPQACQSRPARAARRLARGLDMQEHLWGVHDYDDRARAISDRRRGAGAGAPRDAPSP